VKKYTFNDRQGSRDRECFFCVVYAGKVYSKEEAEEANLAVFRSLDYERAGKWSNTTWEVSIKSASLVVFREPFNYWSEKWEDVILELKESCQMYIGYEPTDNEAVLAFQFCCPKRYAELIEKEQKLSNLI
jgi:hypothetical protein